MYLSHFCVGFRKREREHSPCTLVAAVAATHGNLILMLKCKLTNTEHLVHTNCISLMAFLLEGLVTLTKFYLQSEKKIRGLKSCQECTQVTKAKSH